MRSRVSLFARLTLALALVGIVPLAYAIWSLFDINRAGMNEQVLRTHTVAATTAAERIAAVVGARRTLVQSMAANEELLGNPRSEIAREFLQGLLLSDPAIERIDIEDRAGASVIRVQRRGSESRTGVVPRGMAPQLWRHGSASWIAVTQPVAGGVLRIVSDASDATAALDRPEIGEHAQMMIAVPGASLASFPAAMIDAARGSAVNGSGIFRFPDGTRILGAFAPVAGTPWLVLSRQPAVVAEGIARKMRMRAAVAGLAALVLAAILASIAQMTVVRPIRDMIRAQQRLVGADTHPSRGGEIDQLRRNFQLIERRIVDQEDLGRVFLGRYQVLSMLGHGGMGAVFRGWDPKLQRYVALKTIRFGSASPMNTQELIDSLVREAILGARVTHPNIVAVYDVEDSPKAAFIAMELVDGLSLDRYLLQRGRLRASAAAVLGLAIARALEAAHERGMMHHDVKPANVLLGRDGAIKVTDFGISALLTSIAARERVVYGTPGYIAPEAALGNTPDKRADLFALGAVLYTAVTGENPFMREEPPETLLATVMDTPPPLASVIKDDDREIVNALSETVDALLTKEPDRRIQTATEALAHFRAIVVTHALQWRFEMTEAEPAVPAQPREYAALMPTLAVERLR